MTCAASRKPLHRAARAECSRGAGWRRAVLAAWAACAVATFAHAGQGLSLPPQEPPAPAVSTVVPSVAPTGVPGKDGLYFLGDDSAPDARDMPDTASEDTDDAQDQQEGLASWYGARFHRRRTASGEPFDMYALTAAHPSLPFGTQVCVRSLVTGRSVQVRINDRGPHSGGRIIDLSRAAAQALGMLGLGTKPVELRTGECL